MGKPVPKMTVQANEYTEHPAMLRNQLLGMIAVAALIDLGKLYW